MPHSCMLPIALILQDYGIPVIMYDQIGCGESTRFKDRKGDEGFWTPELFVAELENVITKLGIEHFHLACCTLCHSKTATRTPKTNHLPLRNGLEPAGGVNDAFTEADAC